MSPGPGDQSTVATGVGKLATTRARVLTAVFGDWVGFTLFCGVIAGLALTWHQAVLINDNYAVANALVAVSEGHLDLRQVAYGPGLGTPGVFEGTDGRPYGRNYAQVFFALPVLLVLRVLAAVSDLRILLAGIWVLLLLWTIRGTGRVYGRERAGTIVGSGVALVAFALSLMLATDLPDGWLPFLALQVVSTVAMGLVAVFLYRLVADAYNQWLGVATAIGAVFGAGIGFWATIPKRHSLIALLATLAAYSLYRSRTVTDETHTDDGDVEPTPDEQRRLITSIRLSLPAGTGYRAGAYATSGVAAWVAAPEGFVLGLSVTLADALMTPYDRMVWLRQWGPRVVAAIALITILAFLPFFATNTVIAGNPFQPPRGLSDYSSPAEESNAYTNTTQAPSDSSPDISFSLPLDRVTGRFAGSLGILMNDPMRVYKTFIRSGYRTRTASTYNTILGANLLVLESAPVLGLLAGLVVLSGRKTYSRLKKASRTLPNTDPGTGGPLRVVDVFTLVYSTLLTLLYLPSLPIHAQITVRYLLPMVPLLVYALIRLAAVRKAIANHWETVVWTYTGAVLILGQVFLPSSLSVVLDPVKQCKHTQSRT